MNILHTCNATNRTFYYLCFTLHNQIRRTIRLLLIPSRTYWFCIRTIPVKVGSKAVASTVKVQLEWAVMRAGPLWRSQKVKKLYFRESLDYVCGPRVLLRHCAKRLNEMDLRHVVVNFIVIWNQFAFPKPKSIQCQLLTTKQMQWTE